MKDLVLSELDRQLSSKKNKVILIIYMLHIIASATFIKFYKIGFYDPLVTEKLDSLNFAPFLIRTDLIMLFVICLIPFIESFNNENTAGYYRLVMIRPYKKYQFYLSKIISSGIIALIIVAIPFVIGTLYGYMFLPKVETTRFFFIDKDFSQLGALVYSLKFYLLQYVIVLSVLSISSLLSVIMPNSVLSFLGTITVCILGSLYFRDQLSFFIMNTTSIFDVLANKNNTFIVYNALIIVAGITGSMLIFKKRDYLY